VLGADGVLRAIDSSLVKLLWEAPFEVGRKLRPPRVIGPAVVAATEHGTIAAFSLRSGRMAWTKVVTAGRSSVHLGPEFAGQLLFVAEGRAFLLNPWTGLLVRELDVGGREASGPMVLLGETAFFALRGGGVVGSNLRTGKLDGPGWMDVDEPLALVERLPDLCVLEKGGAVSAWRPGVASPLWRVPLGPSSVFLCAASTDRLCVGMETGRVVCLDARTGEMVWERSLEGTLEDLSQDNGDSGNVVAGMVRSGRLHLAGVSVSEGSIDWEVEVGSPQVSSAQTYDDVLVISAPSRGIVALERPQSRP
jgi:outer membrane protein assembly factor BamB